MKMEITINQCSPVKSAESDYGLLLSDNDRHWYCVYSNTLKYTNLIEKAKL